MAILKMKKIREMGEKDLAEKERELHLELSKDRASSEVGGTVKSPGRIKEIRRVLARIKTHRSAKEKTESRSMNRSASGGKSGSKGVSKSESANRSGEKHDTENLKSKEKRGGKA